MQADVLVLDHDAAGLERVGDVEVLGEVQRRGLKTTAQLILRPVDREGDAVGRADVNAGVALDAQVAREHCLDVAVEAALRLDRKSTRLNSSHTVISYAVFCLKKKKKKIKKQFKKKIKKKKIKTQEKKKKN